MNSKKLWQAFSLIFTYLLLASFLAYGSATLSASLGWQWGASFGIGVVFWVLSLVFFILLTNKDLFVFAVLALLCNAIGAGLFIGAFAVGKNIPLDLGALPTIGGSVAVCYLLLMALLTVPKLKNKIWYVTVCYVLWMIVSIFLARWLLPLLLQAFGLHQPPETGMFLLFFFLLLGFFALGSLFPVDDLTELLKATVTPVLIATFLLLVIVLLCLAGCDDCDCGDGCDGCCDCGDCSGGQYNATGYGKRKPPSVRMSELSDVTDHDPILRS